MASYEYTISTAFTDGKLNPSVFHETIDEDESITAPLLAVDADDGACYVRFDGDLSAGEKTELDTLVANHDGTLPDPGGINGFRSATYENEKTTTAVETWQEAIKLDIPLGAGGEYLISWSAEAKKVGQGSARMRVIIDTDEDDPLTDVDIDTRFFNPISGSKPVILSNTSAHTIYLDIVRNGEARSDQSGTAILRKLRLSCWRTG